MDTDPSYFPSGICFTNKARSPTQNPRLQTNCGNRNGATMTEPGCPCRFENLVALFSSTVSCNTIGRRRGTKGYKNIGEERGRRSLPQAHAHTHTHKEQKPKARNNDTRRKSKQLVVRTTTNATQTGANQTPKNPSLEAIAMHTMQRTHANNHNIKGTPMRL